MVKYAIVTEGKVTNIVVADAKTATANGWIDATGGAIGDDWNDGVFTTPAVVLSVELAREIAVAEMVAESERKRLQVISDAVKVEFQSAKTEQAVSDKLAQLKAGKA